MNAAGRLAVYGTGLVLLFAAGLGAGRVLVPESATSHRQQAAESAEPGEHGAPGEGHGEGGHSDGGDHTSPAGSGSADSIRGLSVAQNGFVLSPVTAPHQVGQSGRLSFTVLTSSGKPVTDFAVEHEKRLHLIVVRTDGTQFKHVHPTLDESTGRWSLPWTWHAAGTYRVFADFVPAGSADAPDTTLSRSIDVAGELTPRPAGAVQRTDTVDGYQLKLNGDLKAGQSTELVVEVSKNGQPVTTLEPYLGAFGHLVALRDGDLAYLHVHPEGDSPTPGSTGGPTISFAVTAPTAGRYLLYLDFQIDGTVRTASFVLEGESI